MNHKCRVHSLEEWNAAVSMFQRQGFRWRGESKTGLLSHNFEPGRFNGLIVAEEMIHFTHDEEFFECEYLKIRQIGTVLLTRFESLTIHNNVPKTKTKPHEKH